MVCRDGLEPEKGKLSLYLLVCEIGGVRDVFWEKYFWGPGSVQTRRADALRASVSRRLCTEKERDTRRSAGCRSGWLPVMEERPHYGVKKVYLTQVLRCRAPLSTSVTSSRSSGWFSRIHLASEMECSGFLYSTRCSDFSPKILESNRAA